MTLDDAIAILSPFEERCMMDDPYDALEAVAEALEIHAAQIAAREPYATISIARYEAAAESVRSLLSDLANAEDEQ